MLYCVKVKCFGLPVARKVGVMNKIMMKTPLVEMDGDEMTRIIWKIIKDELINPFIELKSEYYDVGL